MDTLLWLYLINAVLLITHEIDSAYWREWEMMRLPGGITGFLAIHLPLAFLILWGLVLIAQGSRLGLLFSFVLAGAGLVAFGVHSYFLVKGRPEFKTLMSMSILTATLVISIIQLWITFPLIWK